MADVWSLPGGVLAEVALVEDEQGIGGGRGEDRAEGSGDWRSRTIWRMRAARAKTCAGALDAGVFEEIIGGADAGGIDEADGDAAEVDDFLEGVAGGAGEMAYDGALVTEEAVEEAGFAGIGLAEDYGAKALAEDLALVGGAEEAGDFGADGIELGEQGGAGGGVDVFVRKIDVGLDVGEDGERASRAVRRCGGRGGPRVARWRRGGRGRSGRG